MAATKRVIESVMFKLKLMGRSILGLMRQVWLLPWSASEAMKERRRQTALAAVEAERLDRIRNPSDYRGK